MALSFVAIVNNKDVSVNKEVDKDIFIEKCWRPTLAREALLETQIEKIRVFNRFYTKIIGLLDERLLDTPVSLVEGRVMLEVGRQPGCQARQLMTLLGMDRGHLSRILGRLERGGWLKRRMDPADRRVRPLYLTDQGQELLALLESRSSQLVRKLLAPLTPQERTELIQSMGRIQELLNRPGVLGE